MWQLTGGLTLTERMSKEEREKHLIACGKTDCSDESVWAEEIEK